MDFLVAWCLCRGTVGYCHPLSIISGNAGVADDVYAILAMSLELQLDLSLQHHPQVLLERQAQLLLDRTRPRLCRHHRLFRRFLLQCSAGGSGPLCPCTGTMRLIHC